MSCFSKPRWLQANPRNLAYTNERLRLHIDLAYYESPPGLQVSHRRPRAKLPPNNLRNICAARRADGFRRELRYKQSTACADDSERF